MATSTDEQGKTTWVAGGVTLVAFGAIAWAVGGEAPGTAAFGDAMAPLGVIFAAFALLQAGSALHAQQEELRLTREEMRLQREATQEAASSQDRLAAAQEEANRLTEKQLVQSRIEGAGGAFAAALKVARLRFEAQSSKAPFAAAEPGGIQEAAIRSADLLLGQLTNIEEAMEEYDPTGKRKE